ncbi:hypothetical protein RUND412_006147 [Rhizina undulata]
MPPKRQRRGSGAGTMGKRVKRRRNEEEEEEGIDAGAMSEKEGKAKSGGKGKEKAVLFPAIVHGKDEDGDADSSSLTSFSSQDFDFYFEDVAATSTSKSKKPKAKSQTRGKGKVKGKGKGKAPAPPETSDDSADDSEMEWEDVLASTITAAPIASTNGESSSASKSMPVPVTGDLELTLDKSSAIPLTSTKKKGASSSDRQVRILTHCMHVQFLMFHGALRNSWCCDPELQGVLFSLLTPGILREVERYQLRQAELPPPPKTKSSKTSKDTKGTKGFEQLPQTSDPLLKLLGMLLHWWKKKFTPDAPGLRKNGYKPLSQFVADRDKPGEKFKFTTGRRDKDGDEVFTVFESLGERVEGLEGFKRLAAECRGSRDTGAALFTALMRALGIHARLVVSLQPLGFGFGVVEEAVKEIAVKGRAEKDTMTEKGKGKGKGKRKGKWKGKKVESSEEEDEDEDEDSGSETDAAPQKKTSITGSDLPYPTTWTEVFSPHTKYWISLITHPRPFLSPSTSPLHPTFEPKGRKATLSKQCISYVIAYAADGTAVDVTPKYLSKPWPGKTKGFRIPVSDVPVYGYDGRTVVEVMKRDWFDGVMRGYRKPQEKMSEDERREEMELRELRERVPEEGAWKKKGGEDSIGFYKNNPDFVLERHLKREEAVIPGRSHIRTFITGKGAKEKTEKVYAREDIAICKAVENWYKEGRVIKEGVQPLKQVKRRAATLTRRREIEEKQREGEIVMQGLYSLEQTELYIPPPIINGKIPKNSFGNIDVYVPSMVPVGAVHVPLKSSARVAKKLGIDYAEAVTGFEFKNQRAVPYIEGVVIAAENEDVLRDAWTAEEAEKRRKEDAKREGRALAMWRRFLMGLRILERLGEEYGDEEGEGRNPFVRREVVDGLGRGDEGGFEREAEGGFIRDDDEGGGFMKDGDEDEDGDGGFIKEDGGESSTGGRGGFIVELEEDAEEKEFRREPVNTGQAISLRDMLAKQSANTTKEPSEASDSEENFDDEDEDENTPSPEMEVTSAYFTAPPQASFHVEIPPNKSSEHGESTKPQRGSGSSGRAIGRARYVRRRGAGAVKANVKPVADTEEGQGRRRSLRLGSGTRSKYFINENEGEDEDDE